MKTLYFLVAIFPILFCSSLIAQWAQSGLDGTYVRTISVSGSNLFVGTSPDGIFRSTNDGSSWSPVNTGLTNLNVFAFTVAGSNLFAGTEGSGVFRSINNGINWSPTSTLTDPYVYALANSGTNLFAGADGGGVYLSTNNGTSWNPANTGLTNTRIRALTISGTNLFAGTFGSGVFISSNSGTNWTPVNTGLTNTYINAITVSGTNLFASTEDGIFLSTNNGTSWSSITTGLTNTYSHAIAVFSSVLFAGTEDGVFLSTNNGTNWDQYSTGLTNTVIWALAVSGTNLFAGSNGNGVWKRPIDIVVPVELSSFNANVNGTDVNLTWSTATETNNSGFEVQRKSGSDFVTIGFVRGNGTTTEVQNYSFTDSKLLVGNYSYRLKQVDFDGTFEYSNVINVDLTAPTVFALEQNYPNPFNPSTMISYSIPQSSFVTLKVYDIIGNEVATLVNQTQQAGKYDIRFDASNLSNGVYLYSIKNDNFTSTKKMILMK